MIGTFTDDYLARFYWNDEHHKKIPPALANSLFRRLIFRWDEGKGQALDIYLYNHSYR